MRIERFFEGPLVVLGFVWLFLLIIELVKGGNQLLESLGVVIWIIFIVDFVVKLLLAPSKKQFLRANIITIISLAVPAFRVLRVFRVLRFLRFSRSARLVKVIGSLNRGMRVLATTMRRRAIGYVILLTVIVILAGSAGMFAFESEADPGLKSYGAALWWTTMIITTLGSEYWPQTLEGRILCVLLALYAFAVFGYITATIATFFIGKDEQDKADSIVITELKTLRKELALLRNQIDQINRNERSSQ